MALINQGGKLLLRDGKLGTGQGCCCGGPCNPQTCPNGTECTPPCVCVNGQCVQALGYCCVWSCSYVADIKWPNIENPEDVPEVDPPEGWTPISGDIWQKEIIGVENCDDPYGDVYAAIKAELQAELNALLAGLGGDALVLLDPQLSGRVCVQSAWRECLEYGGTWNETEHWCTESCNPLP